jgi:hypothetical protein
MKGVELYGRVRHAVRIEGLSHREAARRFGIDPRTVAKMMVFSVPPGYRRKKPPVRPKLDPFIGIIDRIMEEDKRRPAKQRHTSKRIFERLRDEHGFAGGLTIVKDYVHERRLRQREVFVPLRHDPGHAQADFGEALAEIGGVEQKIHFFAFDLPHSDASFVQAYPEETTEAFCAGHAQEETGNCPALALLLMQTRLHARPRSAAQQDLSPAHDPRGPHRLRHRLHARRNRRASQEENQPQRLTFDDHDLAAGVQTALQLPAELLLRRCDILVPAATEEVINRSNADWLQANWKQSRETGSRRCRGRSWWLACAIGPGRLRIVHRKWNAGELHPKLVGN